MDINEKKEQIINNEINVATLTSEEVELLKQEVKKDLKTKKEELKNINNQIKMMKTKIDNWAN